MTQHGSNSDRPRGRRARRDSDWSEYDGVPREDREFPDLQPIRPREGRGRHSAPPPDAQEPWGGQRPAGQRPAGQPPWQDQQAAGQPAREARAPWDAPRSRQAPQGFQQEPRGFQQEPVPSHSQYGQSGPQQAASPQYGASQPSAYGTSQPPAGRHSAPQPAAPRRTAGRANGDSGWDDQDSDDPMAAFSERWHSRGQEAGNDRRKRRRLYLAGGGVAAVAIAVLVYFLTAGGGGAADTGLGSLVTTFLPGELQQVPNACSSVPSGTLGQDLPGQLKEAAPPLNTGAQSQCTWTLDKAPTYRVLEVSMTAYSPSGLASGDGSATFAAEDAYAEAETAKQKPGPKSGQPPAAVATIPNLGSSAFSAMQVFTANGAVMDMATVYVRYHNVMIQVVLNGMDRSGGSRQYGPVSKSTLLSQAQSVAQQVAAKVTG